MIFPVRADPSMPAQVASECMMVASEEIEENVKYEAFALEAQDPPGLAILDSGCTRTMHGSEWAHRFEEEISKYDLVPKVRDKRQTFKGIGGAAESKIVKVFPVGIGGSHGVIHSAETDGQTPMLISRPFMQALGTIIDLKNNTVSFSELGISSLPLHRTRRGHLAISLLDFSDIKSNIDFEKAQISEFPEEEVYIHDETYELPIDARIDYDEYDMNPDDCTKPVRDPGPTNLLIHLDQIKRCSSTLMSHQMMATTVMMKTSSCPWLMRDTSLHGSQVPKRARSLSP